MPAKHIIKILIISLLLSVNLFAAQTDTARAMVKQDTVYQPAKSALGALARSALLPGWGQVYNESYWKVPVVWGFIGYFAYQWGWNNDKYRQNSDLYKDYLRRNLPAANNQKLVRDFYRDQRDQFAIYIGLTYALNLLDAYVDAHLFDFSVAPDPVYNMPRFNLRIKF